MELNVTPIVDGHFDLAENVTLFGRDLTRSVATIRAEERRSTRQATVSLPELKRGGIAVAIATVTAGFLTADVGPDFEPRSALYSTPEEAEAQTLAQIALYERWQSEGRVRLLISVKDLEQHLHLWRNDRRPGLVLLMEGADPIVRVDDLTAWWRRGVRIDVPGHTEVCHVRQQGDPVVAQSFGLCRLRHRRRHQSRSGCRAGRTRTAPRR